MIDINIIPGGSIGTNCYLLVDRDNSEALLVDYVPEAERIITAEKLSVDVLLLTHIHYDHIEGLSSFQKDHKFDLYLSEFGYDNINDPLKNLVAYTPFMDEYNNTDKVNLDRTRKIYDDDVIKWGDHSFEVVSSPGHSPDSVMYVLNEKKCVFSGDTLFKMSVGRTDFPGSDHQSMINAINNLFTKTGDDYIVYPGHGDSTTIGFEKKNNPFLT